MTASVTGPVTGRSYAVTAGSVVTVDSRDGSGLLATGYFERVG